MKQIVDGLRYDTSTAKLIGEGGSRGSCTDFRYWEAGLYVTKKGRYFLSGEGGPMSMFREELDGNSWSGSVGIIPLEPEDALDWAEENLEVGEFEKYFESLIEDA